MITYQIDLNQFGLTYKICYPSYEIFNNSIEKKILNSIISPSNIKMTKKYLKKKTLKKFED